MADLSLDIEITRAQNRNYTLADSLFLRYQARAVEEFDWLKALRANLPDEPILEVQPEESKTTCAPPEEPISTPQMNPDPTVNSVAPEGGAVGAALPVTLPAHCLKVASHNTKHHRRAFKNKTRRSHATTAANGAVVRKVLSAKSACNRPHFLI